MKGQGKKKYRVSWESFDGKRRSGRTNRLKRAREVAQRTGGTIQRGYSGPRVVIKSSKR